MNLFLIGFIAAIVIAIVIIVMASYVKCPPNMVYIISGLKKKPRVIIGKATLRLPFLKE